ncbi:hypothetical protein SAMN05444285_11778 [Draconibacterium orientale]|uniref:DUF4843 domain-containing protein n=1 Tax=Draconibacterium orientale TaxID=1168034 RepID=X5DF90_9BACT|nr:hypothetical protein [Draconibacterium orientale]AHW61578.1 hypothetical protein FH5T_04090 [Draconibacterium orientale]SET60388.1 hypothetical protein SAMN05444285_11778 [Draconibacterium orientale]
MKKIQLALLVFVLSLAACDQDNIGELYETDAYVAFSTEIVPANILTAENNYSVNVQIARSNLNAPTTAQVSLEMNENIEGVFDLESTSVSFAEGEGTAYAKIVPLVDISQIDVSKVYEFNLTLTGDNVSEFYSQTTYRASFLLTFEPVGTGTFSSEFRENEWTVQVEKALEADVYKIIDCYAEGYDIMFSVDAENNVFYATQLTGYIDPDYGMVTLEMPDSEEPDSYYMGEPYRNGNTIYLLGRFTVDAGSYGHWYEVLTLP